MRRSSTHLVFLVCALLALTISPAYSWQPNSPYYGAGRRVALSSLRTLTFYAGKNTAYRRTSPLPHLTCIGSPCRRFQPDVVQCTAMGDGQWKCSADLPVTIRMGRVEVSCEGYDYAEDPYVLKDSCALEYTLLPSSVGREGGWDGYGGREGGELGEKLVEGLFWVVFWGVLAMIVVSFVRAIRGNAGNATASGTGGGGGGGGGGGWWPGGSNPPPPPYTPKPEPDSSTSSSWRPGFWTGLGLGGLAASAAASSSRRRQQASFFNPDPYGGYDGNFAAGPSSHFGGRRRGWDDSDRGSSSAWRESTGFGGTRNR